MDDLALSNLSLLPPIRRARGWRLYAEDGRRFLDLWQDGGRGLVGAKGTGVGTVAKAFVDRGLSMPLPSVHGQRLVRAVLREWPGWRAVRVYAGEAEALEALAARGTFSLHDPARLALSARGAERSGADKPDAAQGESPREVLVIRPFADFLGPDGARDAAGRGPWREALVLLPCPRALAPAVCLFASEEEAPRSPGLPAPALRLASAAKALAELEGLRKIAKEEAWRRADRRLARFFERKGPWLFPLLAGEDYARLFRAALASGVLLSPDPGMPSILPPEFDDGELKAFSSLEP